MASSGHTPYELPIVGGLCYVWRVNNNFVGDPVEDQTTSRSSSSTVFACDSYGVVYEVYFLRTVCGMDYEFLAFVLKVL